MSRRRRGGGSFTPYEADFSLPPRRPRIEPGDYTARSVEMHWRFGFGRRSLELHFDIFQADYPSPIIARLPLFLRVPEEGKDLPPSSALAKILYLLGQDGPRTTRGKYTVLIDKLWLVRVEDQVVDSQKHPLPKAEQYSIIRKVLERWA